MILPNERIAHRDAVVTMGAEIGAQLHVLERALHAGFDTVVEAAGALVGSSEPGGPLLLVGIGDSDLVGALAAAVIDSTGTTPCGWLAPLAADSVAGIWAVPTAPPRGALIHSISGSTSVTVAAARHLAARGVECVAVTCEADSPLAAATRHRLVMDIPRYPPDAKVPGTITVTVPLALTLLFAATMESGPSGLPRQFITDLLEDFHTADSYARAGLVEQTDVLAGWSAMAVQIVATKRTAATAAYLQAKLAETIGLGATVSGPETWLHVFKHGARKRTLVVALDVGDEMALAEAVREEAEARGARFCSVQRPAQRGEGALDLPLDTLRPRSRTAFFTDIIFAQRLCLALLQAGGRWAPFQRHRLSVELVKGLRRRIYREA